MYLFALHQSIKIAPRIGSGSPFLLLPSSRTMASPVDNASTTPPSVDSLDIAPGGRASRKRARESTKLEDIFDETFDVNDDGRPKTRRVNPQRLAVRLGPELVAEMEALIVPGAKMPPFAVRKDFQERYSVDRRHIYDYFHSRGWLYPFVVPHIP